MATNVKHQESSSLIFQTSLGVVPEKKNTTFVVIDQNGWEGHCPGPQYKIQTIVVKVKWVGRSKDLNVHDHSTF